MPKPTQGFLLLLGSELIRNRQRILSGDQFDSDRPLNAFSSLLGITVMEIGFNSSRFAIGDNPKGIRSACRP